MKLEACLPPAWAKNGHLQTLAGHYLPSPRLQTKGKKIITQLEDGDQLVSFLFEGTSKTVVSIFHGLAGSTESAYIHRSARRALKQGHSVIVANHRGCGEGVGLAKNPYHSGRGEDVGAVIHEARKIFPRHQHIALGFSMSANALLLLSSGRRGENLPDAAIAFNGPIDLLSTSKNLHRGFSRVYDFDFYRRCRRDAYLANSEHIQGLKLPRLTSLYEMDHLFTAKAAGFGTRENFYEQCSSAPHLPQIKIPTVIVTAKDDPFVDVKTYQNAKLSPSTLLHLEDHGGHMGYINREKTVLGDKRWQDYAVNEAIKFLAKS